MIYSSRSFSTLSVEFTAWDRISDRDLKGRFYERAAGQREKTQVL